MRLFSSCANAACILSLLLGPSGFAQEAPANNSHAVTSPVGADTLSDGTPVKLRLSETISSANAHTGQQVPFEVVEDVVLDGVTVIPKGATALATVTDADHKKTMGRGGKLNLNIDSVRLADKEKVQLRATAGGKGGGHTGAMTGAMIATGVLFFPAAPLFLFMHGKDITLAQGMETTAFVDGDTHLNLTMLAHPDTPQAAGPAAQQIAVDADIANCDILIDGAFVGNTPSTVSLTSGTHEVVVRRKGYADWTRNLASAGGSVTLHAEMQANVTAATK